MSDIIEFQKVRIEALEREIERLRFQLVETEKKTRMSADELKAFINNPDFHKPIQNIEYK
jgi:hypothetical protein